MKEFKKQKTSAQPLKRMWGWILLLAFFYFFMIECYALYLMAPEDKLGLAFGALWSLLLASIVMLLPHVAGCIVYGVSFFAMMIWTMVQMGYHEVFGKLMWIGDTVYAGEGGEYLMDVMLSFPIFLYVAGGFMLFFGLVILLMIPKATKNWKQYLVAGAVAVASIAGLFVLPQVMFTKDNDIWGTHSEYARSSSYEATYETMYDAEKVYDICGIYQLTFRDIWVHMVQPRLPWHQAETKSMQAQIDDYFPSGTPGGENEMTGALEGKNVILVLMESMDDWLITEEDTPTLCMLMENGINFTNFYSPGYGGARTINTEFCINSGIYLPTNGGYVFDYVTNSFSQSIASQLSANGYSAESFHYNSPDFYSRGVFEPALGYNVYNSYEDYVTDDDQLYDDCFLFDCDELRERFFREGQTFNFVITRSAHLSYVYNEVLSNWALKQYPQYRGLYGHEEVDCARVKAKLVDDFFARLLEELEAQGQLENTVIIGVTDHYTYGFKDVDTMLVLSGVEDELLLEKTPCFIWSADGPDMDVDKTLNTADLLPTVLNLLGIDSPYSYLGQDAFDPNYEGYALFTDGSWISDGVVCKMDGDEPVILANEKDKTLTETDLAEMSGKVIEFMTISNLLLQSNYYAK